jgi:hypothetical protein
MTPSLFVRLYEASTNARLDAVYDKVLGELFQNPDWESGPTALKRVRWVHGKRARAEDNETFRSPGLYIWGVEDRPLYVGITCSSFGSRFKRYIWSKKSQCNLAVEFETALISNDGIKGFPPEIINWYARNYPGNSVRLHGSARFAKEGIAKVWFALFPHNSPDVAEIRALERALIPVARKWNEVRGLRHLLNKQE